MNPLFLLMTLFWFNDGQQNDNWTQCFRFITNNVQYNVALQGSNTELVSFLLNSKFKMKICDVITLSIGDRLQRPNYLSRVNHERRIRNRRQSTDIGKNSFVNRTIRLWNRLPAEILGTLLCKPNAFRKRAKTVINVVNGRKCEWVVSYLKSALKWSEVKCSEVKCSEVKCSVVNGSKSGRTVKGIYGWWSVVKWNEGPVKIGVLYLRNNNIRN